MQTVDLSRPRRIHLVGLGGAGMSAIAQILVGRGHMVSGSDAVDSIRLQRLKAQGVKAEIGHRSDNLGDAELVACSTAIRESNPEVVAALSRGLPVLKRAEILRAITAEYETISVAGTHGKTTTSAMLTVALRGAGLDPSYIVGGDIAELGGGAGVGGGRQLVVEADESDGTFVQLQSHAVIITNIEPDHLEFYGGFEPLVAAFDSFARAAPGPCVVCVDDPGVLEMVGRLDREFITYGTSSSADYTIRSIQPTDNAQTYGGVKAVVSTPNGVHELTVNQAGLHNVMNAVGALAMAVSINADTEAAVQALSTFAGVGRRFELRGEHDGIVLIDDYAHLPTEVKAALAAGASLKPERLVAVFQPHRYSRTQDLWNTFTTSFTAADLIVITGIYSSGEDPRPGITGDLIANDIRAKSPTSDVRYIESLEDVTEFLVGELRTGDVCMTLGAGDLTGVPTDVLAGLERR